MCGGAWRLVGLACGGALTLASRIKSPPPGGERLVERSTPKGQHDDGENERNDRKRLAHSVILFKWYRCLLDIPVALQGAVVPVNGTARLRHSHSPTDHARNLAHPSMP